jgi:transcriptional regulatory protein GAL4
MALYCDEAEPRSYEWHEETGDGNMDPFVLDGMGGLASPSGQNTSFVGLSSGATFLKAIRRISKIDIFAASDSFDGGSLDIAALFGRLPAEMLASSFSNPPRETRLPALSVVLPLVDSFFRHFREFGPEGSLRIDSFTPLVHEPTIRAQILGAVPFPSKAGSSVLINMILALGAFDSATVEGDKDGQMYYEIAREALQRDMLADGTLQLVQGLAIMGNYLQRSNRPNAGFMCLGWAIRMAVALGLHVPSKQIGLSSLEQEMRNRVWWALVTLETGCSVTFGRPHGFGQTIVSVVPLPINCEDEHLTVSTQSPPAQADHVTRYSPLIIQARLAGAMTEIHDRILLSRVSPTVELITRWDNGIVQALARLPPFMQHVESGPYRFARAAQLWRARDYRAILYRPILLAAAWDSIKSSDLPADMQQAVRCGNLSGKILTFRTCRCLAMLNLQEIGDFIHSEHDSERGTEWYMLYFAFRSAHTVLLSIVWEPHHELAISWREMILSTAAWFRQLQSMRTVSIAMSIRAKQCAAGIVVCANLRKRRQIQPLL